MDSPNLICIVHIPDGLGYPELGPNFQGTLNQKNSHGSSVLLDLLERFSKHKSLKMKHTNQQTHDDFWLLDFLTSGRLSARVHLNLRRFTELGTEWGLWTDEPSALTNEIYAFLDQTPAVEIVAHG